MGNRSSEQWPRAPRSSGQPARAAASTNLDNKQSSGPKPARGRSIGCQESSSSWRHSKANKLTAKASGQRGRPAQAPNRGVAGQSDVQVFSG